MSVVSALFLFLCLGIFLRFCASTSKQLVIGVFNDDQYATQYALAIALREIQASPSLLPGVNITIVSSSANQITGQPLQAALDIYQTLNMINAGAAVIIGPRLSTDCVQVAYTAQVSSIPVLSFGASSADFSSKANYPTFSRVYPDVGREVKQIAALLLHQNWRRVGIVYSADSVGSSLFTLFQSYSSTVGISILCIEILYGTESNLDYIGAGFANTCPDVRIFLYFNNLQNNNYPLMIWNSVRQAGLMQPGYQWVGSHPTIGVVPYFTFPNGTLNLALFSVMDSVISVIPLIPYNSIWQQLRASILNYTAPVPWCRTTCNKNNAFGTTSHLAAFIYDSMYVVAKTAHHLLFDLNVSLSSPSSRSLFLSTLRSQSFIGASNLVSFDANGDNVQGFMITQWYAGQTPNLGGFTMQNNTYVVSLNNVNSQGADPFVYIGGVKPSDRPPISLYQASTSAINAIFVVSSIVSAALAGITVAIAIKRQDKPVKATGAIFNCICALGGLILSLGALFRSESVNLSISSPSSSSIAASYAVAVANALSDWTQAANRMCVATEWCVNVGYTMIIVALTLKTWRISRIFNLRSLSQVQYVGDKTLLITFAALMSLETALLIGLTVGSPVSFSLELYSAATSSSGAVYIWTCTSQGYWTIWFPTIYSVRALLIVASCVYIYQCRSIPGAFNETSSLVFSVYNLAALSLFLLLVDWLIVSSSSTGVIMYGVAVLTLASSTSAILLLPKICLCMRGKPHASELYETAASNIKRTIPRAQPQQPQAMSSAQGQAQAQISPVHKPFATVQVQSPKPPDALASGWT